MVLAVSGRVKAAEVAAQAGRLFGAIPAGPAGGALVAKACSSLLLFHRLRRLAWVATRTGNIGSAVRRCSTFVRIEPFRHV